MKLAVKVILIFLIPLTLLVVLWAALKERDCDYVSNNKRNRAVGKKEEGEWEKILELLKNGNNTTTKLKIFYPEMSERTLRRRLEKLVNKGLVVKLGKTKDSVYFLKTS